MAMPRTAMVLAAGLGERMRPLTEHMPKPLVPVVGKPLIDHVLDRLAAAGVTKAVVNVHYLADMIEHHLQNRKSPQIVISDERVALLNTGGGVVRALAKIGDAPFLLINSDTIWIDGAKPNLERLAQAFDPAAMDALLLLAPVSTSIGYDGRGDFNLGPDGRLTSRNRAVRLCRRGDPAARAVQRRAGRSVRSDQAVRSRRRSGPASRLAPRRNVDARRHAGGHREGRGRNPHQRRVDCWLYPPQRLFEAA